MFDAMHSTIRYQPGARPTPPCSERQDHLVGGPQLTFSAGRTIFSEGDHAGPLYQVTFGMVRSYRILADGRRQICAFHLPGEVFGLESGSERHFFADAIVRTGLRALRSTASAEPIDELLALAMTSLVRAQDHMLTLACQGAIERVASFLLEMAGRQHAAGDSVVDLPMTRTDIADYLGMTMETVSRAFSKLRRQGVICLPDTHRVEIVRCDELRACRDVRSHDAFDQDQGRRGFAEID